MHTILDLEAQAEQQRAAHAETLRLLEEARTIRARNPVEYLGRLVYENKRGGGGTYGYEYGDYGKSEKDRAQEVLDIVGGNIDTAERVIVKLRVK